MPARRRSRQSAQEKLAGDLVRQLARTRNGRRILVVLAIVALAAWGGFWLWQHRPHERHPVGPTVRVATWNLRQFSPERPGIDLRTIADVIRTGNFDIIAIQEVKKQGEMVDRLLNTLGQPWRSTAMSPQTGNSERFAFIYNADHVDSLDTPRFMDGAEASVFDRRPYIGQFRAGNFDFALLTVHLTYADRPRREREAQALAAFAAAYPGAHSEKDLIILGDFNEEGRGYLHYVVAKGFVMLSNEPSNLGSTQAYDTLLIEPKFTGEWSGKAGAIRFDESYFANDDRLASDSVSDHRPVWADFVTTLPDDD